MTTQASSEQNLVIILVDGFRWDYQQKLSSPNVFERFETHGVKAKYVQTIMPSASFPSWTSIVTGLYPDEHNILGNRIWDPRTKLAFILGEIGLENDKTANPIWWQSHIPLWTSAEHEGIQTSLYQWSRCDVPFKVKGKEILPSKYERVDNDACICMETFENDLKRGVEDLKEGIRLLMVYHAEPDLAGHNYGPDSQEVLGKVKMINMMLQNFLLDLEKNNLLAKTNVVLVSDHGMLDTSQQVQERVTEFTDPNNLEKIVERGAWSWIKVAPSVSVDNVKNDLDKWTSVEVFKTEEIPEAYHLRDTRFSLDLLVVSKGDVVLAGDPSHRDLFLPKVSLRGEPCDPGRHGYSDISKDDPGNEYIEGNCPEMRTIFYAMGPAFKQGYKQDWIKLVDEYQIFKHVLKIRGERHHGTFARVKDMFVE